MSYSFQAGPEDQRYTVETPWTPRGVELALLEISATHPWVAKDFNAQLFMLVTAPFLDSAIIDPMDGSGLTITGAEIRENLTFWDEVARKGALLGA